MSLNAVFPCAACGERAATVWLVLPGAADPPQAALETGGPPVMDGLVASALPAACRLIIHGGPAPVVIAPVSRAAAEPALRASDGAALHASDAEFAPFWCPTCGAAYCGAHWTVEMMVDEGFVDGIRGTCPKGHARLLAD